ncbi:protein O-linked-mannose beta-1,2-N-acetylglucosaminyltransferase 1-like [Xenia sp. Carnegie-2017]|uniref:protein O-linked-mannose beta-1,2-N-acetylglucosaminyltransferase 1-like n=1 Tax=Xenia sp. Carnegie-2017 TaxID=2897299 RepID=UPI001F03BFEF|nr:protein O-linked-mannose beta-1,2-N-acetylglucosaminyltransferase 1-like [Xenia sp. Carnegie-2017]
MSWTPNPNAKPFYPTNISHNFNTPCFSRAWNFCLKRLIRKCFKWLLVFILILTTLVNVLFVMSTKPNDRNDLYGLPNHYRKNRQIEEKRVINMDDKDCCKIINIEVHSSKDNVYVSVNGTKVMEEETYTRDAASRGIHVTVLHQSTGAMMATKVFDTCRSKQESANLVHFLNMISDGRILCFAVKDEIALNLEETARDLLKSLGSAYVDELKYRDSWSFIVTKRGQKYSEKHHHAADTSNWAEPVTARATVNLVPAKQSQCAWDDSEESKQRRMFCDKFEGYGSLCSCNNPAPIEIKTTPLKLEKIQDIPVAVIASNRPHYLYRGLRSMLSAHGAKKELFTVFIDGFFEEPAAVARLYDVKVEQHIPISCGISRIAQHYKRTLTETFNAYPNARYMIILEEDLDVSVDIFSYFNQLLPLMDTDESLYCISAWNDQSYNHTCNDPAMLYRVETMPGLGWLLKRRLYKDELEPKWPKPDHFINWDEWMRIDRIKKGRECIIPDISRTYHFGAKGQHINIVLQESLFKTRSLNTVSNVKFNVSLLIKKNYENEIERLTRLAEPLNHSKNPCKNETDFVPETSGKTYIYYIEMKHAKDWTTWNNIARCLRIWYKDARGFHKSMWRLWLKGNHVLIVGSPASPYAKHKPINVKPIFIPSKN